MYGLHSRKTWGVENLFAKLRVCLKILYTKGYSSLNCESLYSRRVKCDLVMCYQMLTGSVNIDTNDFFSHVPTLVLLEATL